MRWQNAARSIPRKGSTVNLFFKDLFASWRSLKPLPLLQNVTQAISQISADWCFVTESQIQCTSKETAHSGILAITQSVHSIPRWTKVFSQPVLSPQLWHFKLVLSDCWLQRTLTVLIPASSYLYTCLQGSSIVSFWPLALTDVSCTECPTHGHPPPPWIFPLHFYDLLLSVSVVLLSYPSSSWDFSF